LLTVFTSLYFFEPDRRRAYPTPVSILDPASQKRIVTYYNYAQSMHFCTKDSGKNKRRSAPQSKILIVDIDHFSD